MSDWIDVVKTEELPDGAWTVIEIEGDEIAVINLDGEYYAIENICTHDSGELTGGDIEGDEVVCPRHGARFSIKTGEVMAPPAYEDIAIFPVRVEQGMVQVRNDRWD